MKKRLLSLFVVLTIIVSMTSSASAIVFQSDLKPTKNTVTANEYDYIVNVRRAQTNLDLSSNSISPEELEYITSDAIEKELVYRSTLPENILRENYCYSDEAIKILKEYNGEKLENNPELRAVTATLRATLGEYVGTTTRTGVIYTWEWNARPLNLWSDYAAVIWEGTYRNGAANNMRFDPDYSHAVVEYYYSSARKESVDIDFCKISSYKGAAINFPMEKYMNGWYYWAKSGSMFIYMDLVNQTDGNFLYELSVEGQYAHYSIALGAGVSFPAGFSVSFSGSRDILGTKRIFIQP